MFRKKVISIVMTALMIVALIPAGIASAGSTWGTATPLAKDTPAQFTIPASNSEEWYKITIPSADQTVSISVDRVAGGRFEGAVSIWFYQEETLLAGRNSAMTTWANITMARDNMNYKLTDAGTY